MRAGCNPEPTMRAGCNPEPTMRAGCNPEPTMRAGCILRPASSTEKMAGSRGRSDRRPPAGRFGPDPEELP